MTLLEQLEQKVLLERLVIGLEEPVLIKGLGELSAKIDSGNGGYNVIHGTDFHQQGDELMFTTHDSFGHEKKMQTKVIDTIEVNMGGGNIENRPVIELDIKFAGEDYKKIPFSVSDRSTNTNPILISKGFVEKQLEALIDVGKKNISTDGIDVVYGEGLGSFFKGAANMAGKGIVGAAKTAWNGIKNAGDYLQGGANANIFSPLVGGLKMSGDAIKAGLGTLGMVVTPLVGVCKLIMNKNKIVKEDINLIKTKLPHSVLHRNLKQNKNVILTDTIWQEYEKFDFKNAQVIQFASFRGRAGNDHVINGMQQRVKAWKNSIKNAKKAVDSKKGENNNTSTQEQEQQILMETYLILQDDSNTEPPATQSIPATTGDAIEGSQPEEKQSSDDETTPNQNQNDDLQLSEQQSKEIQQTTTQFKQLKNFIIYFVPAASTRDKKDKISINQSTRKDIEKFLKNGNFDNLLVKLFNIGDISKSSITPIIRDLATSLRQTKRPQLQGSFVLSTGDLGKRSIEFFDKLEEAVVATKENYNVNSNSNVSQQIVQLSKKKFANLKKSLSFSNKLKAINDQNIWEYSDEIEEAHEHIEALKRENSGRIDASSITSIINDTDKDGVLTTAIIKNYLNSNNLMDLSEGLTQKFGDNWTVKSFEDFIKKISQIQGIKEILEKMPQSKTPKFDNAQKDALETIGEPTPQSQGEPIIEEPVNDTPESQQGQVNQDVKSPETKIEEPTPQESKDEQNNNNDDVKDSESEEEEPLDSKDDKWIKNKLDLLKRKGVL